MVEPGITRMLRPVVILGPTAGGKSELAVMLAERLRAVANGEAGSSAGVAGVDEASGGTGGTGGTGGGGQIIGADSMQIYRHLNAGTAKPTPGQRARVPHHLIDIVEPTERFTVADWLAQADAMIESLQSRGFTPIVVGGTNLYIKALLEGMFEGPAIDDALRQKLNETDLHQLRARLEAVDPPAAARIHPNDRKRTVRALEVFEQTGRRISELQTQWGEEKGQEPRHEGTKARSDDGAVQGESLGSSPLPPDHSTSLYRHDPILIGLAWPAEAINPRINLRVKAMFFPHSVPTEVAAEVVPTGENLIDETRRLKAAGLLGPQASKALGYQQVLDHFDGKCSLDDAFERTKILTRQYAKSQRTWLKRYRGVHWIEAEHKSKEEIADEAMRILGSGV